MAVHFFDTSALAKHYRAEVGTDKVDALMAQVASQSIISALAVVELHSAFALLTRMGQITAAEFSLSTGRFVADIAAGTRQVSVMSLAHSQSAQQLVIKHGTTRDMRTLDAIQLAVALSVSAASPLDGFVCADANLCSIAAMEGLRVINPEMP